MQEICRPEVPVRAGAGPTTGSIGTQSHSGIAPNCDCAFTSVHQNNLVNMPLRMRHGGTLARTLYRKTMVDHELRQMDKRTWYQPELTRMPSDLRGSFVELDCDSATEDFLEQAEAKSESILLQLWHSLVKLLLGWFFTQTSLNGFLGRGSMFVFSSEQFARLVGGRTGGRLLDLGAGDGAVTSQMEPFFDHVSVTEISAPMRKILARKKYSILEINSWAENGPWDVISCLNVLDRCSNPKELLKQIHDSLTPSGKAIIAIVLPYQPYVETGGKGDHQPEERLPIEGITYDEQVTSFVTDVLGPADFQVEKWTRLPYLCEGDLQQAFYWLSDAVFVVRKATIVSS
ncbi:protein-L-histidine N-pros-methyltransferase isoform X1 [Frankliniella occidentalis]|uniref:Protein-L-histidine N-pros-methyltransferase isoform X1 n=1 Tax=Frankliniella occidentalis TaxID=133901 RepID=A0A6J1TIZ5_FRAOC|nr:protein-L-histidine N-pros-methyltransferase isoform X1 [Frankliniella occidentalis]